MKMRTETLLLATACLSLILLGILYLGSQNRATNFPSQGTDVIAFGDSLVEGVGSTSGGGFVKILSKDLGVPVINLGVRGDTTKRALSRISVLDNYNPKVVIVLLGGNDYLSGVSEEETYKNLAGIVDAIHARGAVALILGLQTSVLDGKHAELFKKLVQEKNVAYVPDIMRGVFGVQRYMHDSLHPNDLGYGIIADRIEPVLKGLIN